MFKCAEPTCRHATRDLVKHKVHVREHNNTKLRGLVVRCEALIRTNEDRMITNPRLLRMSLEIMARLVAELEAVLKR
jgi:hypothetical protein